MKLIISPNAKDDLKDISQYIAAESIDAAVRILTEIEAALERLGRFPYIGVACDSLKPGYRMLVIGDYNALYRVEENAVHIDFILHHAQDIKTALDS